LDLFRAVGAPLGEAPLQLRPAGRGDEDTHRVGPLAGDLDGTLDLDVQNHVLALLHGLVHIALGRSVEVAHILGVLQELLLGDPLAEGVHVHEVIVDAVQLAGPGVAGGGGDREVQVFPGFQQGGEHCALAHAGGAGNDERLAFSHGFNPFPQ
jgi:hypothetical protein